ncbi:hypothetical protein ILYODFUR_021141 [Ilyodon furcidens]|uniref:Uncharacterized protein n=1 Tax=Ilyodon furcidens TaxID=33524 RepID=A0ABV0VFS9_9TELE
MRVKETKYKCTIHFQICIFIKKQTTFNFKIPTKTSNEVQCSNPNSSKTSDIAILTCAKPLRAAEINKQALQSTTMIAREEEDERNFWQCFNRLLSVFGKKHQNISQAGAMHIHTHI